MKAQLGLALLLAVAPATAQRGVVSGIRPSDASVAAGTPVTLNVTGTNPCGAVNIDYGDGNVVTHPISDVPAAIPYTYRRAGAYRIVAKGMGNCDGEATTSIRVTEPPAPPPPPAPNPAERRARDMDRNGDGVISREEWPGSDQAFRAADWNRDGILSGDEVPAARRAVEDDGYEPDPAHTGEFSDWTDRGFSHLDRNRDGRISRDEWRWTARTFDAHDRNGDGVLSRGEFEPLPDRSADRPGTIVVDAREPWTDTGIDVRAGDIISVDASGTVQLSGDASDIADPGGARSGRRAPDAPVRQALAGALIARIGSSRAVAIPVRVREFRAPEAGRLYLGINDDYLGDNGGQFRVRIVVDSSRR
jgi:PA-IL-like protein/EF hand domain-containing protein